MNRSPSFTEVLECRHCFNKAPMLVVGSVQHLDKDNSHGDHGDLYEIVSCPACEKATVRVGHWNELMDVEDWHGKVIYPTGSQQIEGLPPIVDKEYRAAEQVSRISANAYAVLLGRVLDVVCQDRKATGDTLYKRLFDLANRNEIPKNLAEVANSLRQMRNVGAHADLGELNATEVPILSALCRAVLEYVYAAPKLVEQAESLVKAVKSK